MLPTDLSELATSHLLNLHYSILSNIGFHEYLQSTPDERAAFYRLLGAEIDTRIPPRKMVEPIVVRDRKPEDFVCATCNERMRSWSDMDEYQHQVGNCGGVVRVAERWPNTENVRARQAAGQPVSFMDSIQARPPSLDSDHAKTLRELAAMRAAATTLRQYVIHDSCASEGGDDEGGDDCDCGLSDALSDLNALLKEAPSIDELIANSSIGRGLANIRENGIEAELADLEAQPSFRIRTRKTRKKPTRKAGIGSKARKKR